jgi:hypothetical protein
MLAYKILLDKQKLFACKHQNIPQLTTTTITLVEDHTAAPDTEKQSDEDCPSSVCRCQTLKEVLDQLHEIVGLINNIVRSIEKEHQRYLHSWSYFSGPADVVLIQQLLHATPLLQGRLERLFECQAWVQLIVNS